MLKQYPVDVRPHIAVVVSIQCIVFDHINLLKQGIQPDLQLKSYRWNSSVYVFFLLTIDFWISSNIWK